MNKRIFLALLAAVCVVGCKGNPIVGTWVPSGPGGGASVGTLTFKGDKTFEADMAGSTTPIFAGTYETKDKEVDLTLTKSGGIQVPDAGKQAVPATVSDDGKTLTFMGSTFTKQ
jgi:hypothetical protein